MNKCSETAIKHYLQNHVLGHSAPTLTYTKECGLLEMVSTFVNIKLFFQDFLIENFKQYLSVATYSKVKDIELTSPIVEVK